MTPADSPHFSGNFTKRGGQGSSWRPIYAKIPANGESINGRQEDFGHGSTCGRKACCSIAMSLNPYHYDSNPYKAHPQPQTYEQPATGAQGLRSHWSIDYGTKKHVTPTRKGNFVEKFSPPMSSKGPAPYTYDRAGSRQSSYHDSPPESYHDSPEGSTSGRLPRRLLLENSATLRTKLNSDGTTGTRSRVLVFLGLCSLMLLLMLIIAGIWIRMDIVKKRIVTGLNNVAISDVRSS